MTLVVAPPPPVVRPRSVRVAVASVLVGVALLLVGLGLYVDRALQAWVYVHRAGPRPPLHGPSPLVEALVIVGLVTACGLGTWLAAGLHAGRRSARTVLTVLAGLLLPVLLLGIVAPVAAGAGARPGVLSLLVPTALFALCLVTFLLTAWRRTTSTFVAARHGTQAPA